MPVPDPDLANLRRLGRRAWDAVWDFVAVQVELHRPPPSPFPRAFAFHFTQEIIGMAVKHRAIAQLPPLPTDGSAADIDHLEVSLTVDGGEPVMTPLAKDATEFDAGLYNVGQVLSASLVYVDASGLTSVHPATADGTVVDQTAPPDPGEFAFAFRQEVVPDEPPAPPDEG